MGSTRVLRRLGLLLALLVAMAFGYVLPDEGAIAAAQAVNYPVHVAPVWTSCVLTDGTAVVCKASGASILGVLNNSLSAQTATVTCYDNATAASGTVAWKIGPLGISQQITFPPPGRPTYFGLTCQASGAPTGGNVEIQFL